MAALVVNVRKLQPNQIINVLNAQIHDAMLNDRLSETQENTMFAADDEASLKDNWHNSPIISAFHPQEDISI